ncbi:MAG TPA: hypothetical protein VKZ97_03435, partial [Flavobacteriaceae bacterium]|nr:hypothetical protein [Flavobacteriaceae bacterium]
ENDPPTDGVFPGDLITFDKLVMITAVNASGLETQIYLYINTDNGDIATITGKAGNSPDGSFNIEDPKFRMQYFNSHGRVYNFFTRKKNGNIVKYMSSLNTEMHFYSSGIPFQRTTVYRTGDGINPLPQNFDANSYKASGSNAPILVLCGGKPGTEPNKLLLKRFIGYSGIGYVKTDEGIFMVVKVKSGQGSFTATKWKSERYKIRVSDFQHIESAMYEELATNNEKETQKLEAKTFDGDCADIESQINTLKLEQQRKEKTNIENMTRGSVLTDANTRNAMKGLYGDPIEQLEIDEMTVELKLCKWEQIRVKTDYDTKRKACYMEEKARIQQTKSELIALKQRYSGPNDPPLLMTPEYRAILKRMQTKSTNCK